MPSPEADIRTPLELDRDDCGAEEVTHEGAEIIPMPVRVSISDTLESDDIKMARQILNENGIRSRRQLLESWLNFLSGDKKLKFASGILGKKLKDLSVDNLIQIADRIGLPEFTPEEKRVFFLSIIKSAYSIHSKADLVIIGPTRFSQMEFPIFGSGITLARHILGKSFKHMNFKTLSKIANKLGLK